MDNSELGIRNAELDSILKDSFADIAVDYKFNDENNFALGNKIIPLAHNQSNKK